MEIIKQETLEKINIDIINFHPGLLPKYRGLFPNFYSLMNNEKNIGFTLHKVNNKIDSGQIIKKYLIPINKKDGGSQGINPKRLKSEVGSLSDKSLIQPKKG